VREPDDAGRLELIAADGRPLLQCTALALLFSGAFALFLSIRREFLPHDVALLGMTPDQLRAVGDCRVVAFSTWRRRWRERPCSW
jgi:hypothetical protein